MNKYFQWTLIGLMSFTFILVFAPFYSEILLAAVFAFALDPIARRLAQTKLFLRSTPYFLRTSSYFKRRKKWVAITLASLFLIITLPIAFAVYNVYDALNEVAANGFQNSEFYKDMIRLKSVLIRYADQLLTVLNLKRKLDLAALGEQFVNEAGQMAVSYSGKFIAQLPHTILYIFVFCCALYFFLAENKRIKTFLVRSQLISDAELSRLITVFQKTSSSTLFASVVTGFIQASVVSIGSVIFNVGDAFVVFVVTFFLSFIPVIGAAPVALFLGLISLIKGDYSLVIGFIVIAIIAGTVDNFVRPYLFGTDEDIHPVVVLLGIIGGIIIFGLPGLFLGPVIVSVTLQLFETYMFDVPEKSPQPPIAKDTIK